MAEVRPAAAWLTVDELLPILDRPKRTVQRWVARWHRDQWPRVRRVSCRGNPAGRLEVERASFDAYCRGEAKPVEGDTAAAA